MNEAAQWRDLLHKKDREIEALHRQIDWLTQQLRRLNGRVYGRSSERSAELQEQLCLFEASSHETVRETPSEASVLCRRKKRCGKREADFSGLPVEQILHELPQEQRRCPQCGGELHACGHSVLRRELTYIPAQYKLTEHTLTIDYNTNGMPDYNADRMYASAKENGTEYGGMDTMPDIVGLGLWKQGHWGVYVGNGYAIEAMGTQYGVVRTKVEGRGWQGWCKIPYIQYDD